MSEIAVCICFAAELFGLGIRRALVPDHGFRVVGEARAVHDALRLCATLRPDVLLLDLDEGQPTLAMLDQLEGLFPQMSVVVVGGDVDAIDQALALGAAAHLPTTASSDQLRQVVGAAWRALPEPGRWRMARARGGRPFIL